MALCWFYVQEDLDGRRSFQLSYGRSCLISDIENTYAAGSCAWAATFGIFGAIGREVHSSLHSGYRTCLRGSSSADAPLFVQEQLVRYSSLAKQLSGERTGDFRRGRGERPTLRESGLREVRPTNRKV
jgi:hypothetical protein